MWYSSSKSRDRSFQKPLSERKCTFCDQESVEDEFHFILNCPKYNIERQNLLEIYLSNLVGDNVAKLYSYAAGRPSTG